MQDPPSLMNDWVNWSFSQYANGKDRLTRHQMKLAVISMTGKKPTDLPRDQNSFTIEDLEQYVRILNSGNFGMIYLATYRGIKVAVKCPKTTKDRKKVIAEAKTMYQLKHPRLVRLFGICCEPIEEPVWLILEYMANGALNTYLPKNKPPYEKLLNILFQVNTNMNTRTSSTWIFPLNSVFF